MVNSIPKDANEFVESHLSQYLQDLESALESDILSVNGLLLFGVDDAIRKAVEERRQQPQSRQKLAVILTTAGGYIEVVQRIVHTLHHHYDIVNFIVPNYAFSAGTVLVMSGNDIYMNYYSCLGPIDPQVETESGQRVPALGYLIQWERLLEKANNGTLTMAEMGLMVNGFDQAALYKYEQERALSIAFLEEWLVKYKFKNWKITETQQKKLQKLCAKRERKLLAKSLMIRIDGILMAMESQWKFCGMIKTSNC